MVVVQPKIPSKLAILNNQIRACQVCVAHLPCGANPIVRLGNGQAKIMLIGQAPGTKVHETGIPWNDASGDRLRLWLGLSRDEFYDDSKFAIMPMGFCYPGKGTSGDLPPRPECAPLWHQKILSYMPKIQLTLLVGSYAQAYYLSEHRSKTLTENILDWPKALEKGFFPLAHPSPRNGIWLRKNPWFEHEIVPVLRTKIEEILRIK